MKSLLPTKLALSHAKIGTGSADENAVLILADDHIVAIFVQLDDPCHGADRGRWHLEASFGRCTSTPRTPFRRLEDGLQWVSSCLGILGDANARLSADDRELLRDADDGQ